METVDNLKEVIWCGHLECYGDYLKAQVPTVLINAHPPIYLIVEEGKVKLLCGRCLRTALELRQKEFSKLC